MKPKYSIGEVVKIKATGEKVKISSYQGDLYAIKDLNGKNYKYKVSVGWKIVYLAYESELKPYRPSRTGKYRNKRGQFMRHKHEFNCLHSDGCTYCFCGEKDPNSIPVGYIPDSNQRNYQKILSIMERIEKKIDELGRKV